MTVTPSQKRELIILRDMHCITTMGYGPRHWLLMRLKEKGLVSHGGPGFNNMFTLTPIGDEYIRNNFPQTNKTP